MKTRSKVIIALLVLMGAGAALAHHFGGPRHIVFALVRRCGGNAHMQRQLGQALPGSPTCYNCHFSSLQRLPWAQPRPHHDAPAGLAVSPDGARLFIALDDKDEVAEADTSSRQVLRRAKVPGAPYGLALDTTGKNLFVTCRNGDRLAVLDTQTLQEVRSIAVGMGPTGVAFCKTEEGARLVVANSMSDDISILSLMPLQELARLPAGREPFAVAARPGEERVYVANRMVGLASARTNPAAELTVVEPASARVVRREPLESAHLSESVCLVPGRAWALSPIVNVHNFLPMTQTDGGWLMMSGLVVTDTRNGGVIQMPLDEANDGFSDPSGVVVDPAGTRAFIASGGSAVVTAVDLQRLAGWLEHANVKAKTEAIHDLSLSPEYVLGRIPTGHNPRQLALSPDGTLLFIAERLDDSILLVDTRNLTTRGRIVLGDGGNNDPVRRGERVFTSSAHALQHQVSCRSCHPDGHEIGLLYDFDGDGIGKNLLQNRTLWGVAGTEPLKWGGWNASLDVHCGPAFARAVGRIEMLSQQELRDLTAFLRSLPPARAARTTDSRLAAAQERGRALFFATKTPAGQEIPVARRCATCHRPPLYTVRLSFNVDTQGPTDTIAAYDVPKLLGVGHTAPYLHDGRAQTLQEIWTLYNTNDHHGVSSCLTRSQIEDLVEFLKTL
jgi:YVTN family beta-propeller protein